MHKSSTPLFCMISKNETPPNPVCVCQSLTFENPFSPKHNLIQDSWRKFFKMLELIKKPSRKNRGIVVKMRFLHNRKFQYENTTRLFCCRHFKWLLWFALSSYFFISFLISHTPNPVKPVSSSSSKASISRVVIEPHIPLSHQGINQFVSFFVCALHFFLKFKVFPDYDKRGFVC